MSRQLPVKANISQLKIQAKELQKAFKAGDKPAIKRLFAMHPRFVQANDEALSNAKLKLSDFQLVVAREYGFLSWAKLAQHLKDRTRDAMFPITAFIDAAVPQVKDNHRAGNLEQANALLAEDPTIVRANIFTAVILGEADWLTAYLKSNPEAATQTGGPRNWSPLLYACFSRYLRFEKQRATGIVDCARQLLAAGASPQDYFMSGNEKETALYGAAGVANHPGMTNLLLAAGADVNDAEVHYHLAEFDNRDCFKIFFDHGINQDGQATLLLRKLDFDNIDSVRYLLELGADPNAKGIWGKAALHQAIMRNRSFPYFQLLWEFNADINAKTSDGKSVLALAMRYGRRDVIDWLQREEVIDDLTDTERFLGACALADKDTVKKILDQSPNLLDELSGEDLAIISDAARQGHIDSVTVMLDAGFDINAKGLLGATALHWAAWHGNAPLVDLILKHNPEINLADDVHKGDALVWALHGTENNDNNGRDYARVIYSIIKKGESELLNTWGSQKLKKILKKFGIEE